MLYFPILPYLIVIDTLCGAVNLNFAATEYHLPSTVIITGSDNAVKMVRSHFGNYPTGMWGSPINTLDFSSPMDVLANLSTNAVYYLDPIIVRYEVIGYVPDELPPEIHPDYDGPAEDDDDDSEGEGE